MAIIGIVCADKNWGIGFNNQLLFDIKEDMEFFKFHTLNNTVIMGLNTYKSIGKPLKNRKNIVLSFEPIGLDPSVDVFTSIDQCLGHINRDNDIYIIGGATIYNSFLPYYDKIYVTKVNAEENADTYFPNLDLNNDFKLDMQTSPFKTKNGYDITFNLYSRRK